MSQTSMSVRQSPKLDTHTALETIHRTEAAASDYGAYVGLDVHKETITVAVAEPGRGAARNWGEIANRPQRVARLVEHLTDAFGGQVLLFSYEAGPCGYGLYHQLCQSGHDCQVVAPSLIPKKPGERIKTDRRDAGKLAVSARSGELTAVWVSDAEQEAMRDLTRARDDFKAQQKKARQQLNAFVLRHGHHWPANKTRWNKGHYAWLESLTFDHDWQHVVLQEYIDAVRAATARVADLDAQLQRVLPQWSLAPVVEALKALRGIDTLSAMGLLAELGDLSRFEHPRQLMGFLGLVPGEHSSGSRRRQGAITRSGNRRARRLLVEAAWSYRFPPRRTAHIKRKAAHAPILAKQISWKAQKRLCGRYRSLLYSGKNTKQVTVAVARELAGFIWDIACQVMPRVCATA
ncbi:MAG TPA: IS110 family transposase [Gammaproteobacteria bacterium]|nr:IS110 family transposase [Gammaproteobacteria bacterium]